MLEEMVELRQLVTSNEIFIYSMSNKVYSPPSSLGKEWYLTFGTRLSYDNNQGGFFTLGIQLLDCGIDYCTSCPSGGDTITTCTQCGVSAAGDQLYVFPKQSKWDNDRCISQKEIPAGYGIDIANGGIMIAACTNSSCKDCYTNNSNCARPVIPLLLVSKDYFPSTGQIMLDFDRELDPTSVSSLIVTVFDKVNEES